MTLREKIIRHLDKTAEPVSSLASRSGVCHDTITHILQGVGNPTMKTHDAIIRAIALFKSYEAPMKRRRSTRFR